MTSESKVNLSSQILNQQQGKEKLILVWAEV